MTGRVLLVTLGLTLLFGACDSGLPSDPDDLVVEAYFRPDFPPPSIRVSRLGAFGVEPARVTGADVEVAIDEMALQYVHAADPGRYEPPPDAPVVAAGTSFRVEVTVDGRRATASGRVPWPLRLDSLRVRPADGAVEAVLLDSLSIPFDSLVAGTGERTGWVFPVQADLWWPPPGDHDEYWVSTRLSRTGPSSGLADLFLHADEVLEEQRLAGSFGTPRWSGVYAVSVAGPGASLPPHTIRAVVVRGNVDWARHALSNTDPDQREPVGNVNGALGIVVGISVDTLSVVVR